MANIKEPNPGKAHHCPFCNGSGQTSYFGGESRFMFTWEDCPDCCGTGVRLDESHILQDNTKKPPQER